ncbi:MAG: hypothetical protein ABJD11_12665 [Gemmatimonadota bacterium]
MSAYNVRKNKTLDRGPEQGPRRRLNLLREILVWILGLAGMYLVYWLVRRYLR